MANILVLTYWNYSDALIQTYTLPYVRMIRKAIGTESSVHLLTLEKSNPIDRTILPSLAQENIRGLPLRYYPFGLKALLFWVTTGFRLTWLIFVRRIDVIHCWGTPPGAIGYVLSLLTDRKLVLDSYEPHAEAMVENGTWSKSGIAYRLLFWLEKRQTRRATHIISATAGMYHYAKEKYATVIEKFYVKPAGVDLKLFNLSCNKRAEVMSMLGLKPEHIVCVYAGKFGGIYLEQEVFDFFSVAERFWGHRFRAVLLTNSTASQIDENCRKSGLHRDTVIARFVSHHEVPVFMGVADFAITPVKPVPSKRYCTPIKNGEYWALGLPVVIPANISDDASIIETHKIGAVLYELNHAAYHGAICKIDELIKTPGIQDTIRKVADHYRNFDHAEDIYMKLYAH